MVDRFTASRIPMGWRYDLLLYRQTMDCNIRSYVQSRVQICSIREWIVCIPISTESSQGRLSLLIVIALDPEHEVYNDSWVKKWFTALPRNNGDRTYSSSKVPLGGIEMNGREIYDEGVKELDRSKKISSYELPPLDMIVK